MKGLLMAACVVGASAFGLSAVREDASAAVIALAMPDGCVWCMEDCEEGMHKAGDGGMSLPESYTRNGGAHLNFDCKAGLCANMHGPTPCDESGGTVIPEPETEALLATMKRRDADAFKRIAAAYPKSVVVNTERAAVQIVGCNGLVLAHLPTDHQFVAKVSE